MNCFILLQEKIKVTFITFVLSIILNSTFLIDKVYGINLCTLQSRPRNGPSGPIRPSPKRILGRAGWASSDKIDGPGGLWFLLGRSAQYLTKAFSSVYIDIAIDWNNKCSL